MATTTFELSLEAWRGENAGHPGKIWQQTVEKHGKMLRKVRCEDGDSRGK
jgi:hypothetical protein